MWERKELERSLHSGRNEGGIWLKEFESSFLIRGFDTKSIFLPQAHKSKRLDAGLVGMLSFRQSVSLQPNDPVSVIRGSVLTRVKVDALHIRLEEAFEGLIQGP